jgi:tetratricopeptide (TPR) repeat protein
MARSPLPAPRAALVAALALASCGDPAPVPVPAPVPAPPSAPAEPAPAPPAGGGVPAPAPPPPVSPATEAERAYDLALSQGRQLAGLAVGQDRRDLVVEAMDAFERAARIRPNDPVPLAEAGLLASDIGDAASMARLLERVRERAPDSGAYRWLRGTILHRQEDFESAAAEFRLAAVKDYRPGEARDRLFKALLALGVKRLRDRDLDRSVAVLEEALALNPDHPLAVQAWFHVGVAQRRLGLLDRAEATLRETTKRFPTFSDSFAELGTLLQQRERHEEALSMFDRAVRNDPGFAPGYVLKAAALVALGRLDDAGKAFEEYDRRFPPAAASELERGVYLVQRRKWEEALGRFQFALAADPGFVRAHSYMAQCYHALGRKAEAEQAEARWRRFEEQARAAMESHGPAHGAAPPGPDAPK